MGTIINMPSLSPSMETGTLESWAKNVGDTVESGDVLANIETDKAVVEYETLEDGIIRHFFIQPGDTVPVGTPVAVISETAEEDVADLIASAESQEAAKPIPMTQPDHDAQASATAHRMEDITPEVHVPLPAPSTEGRIKASPLAKKIAAEQGIDIATIRGSGPNGRVVKADVEQAVQLKAAAPKAAPAAAPAPKPAPAKTPAPDLEIEGEYEEIPLTGMRKTIANRLLEATQGIPHFFLTTKVQVDALLALRKKLNATGEVKVSLNDMIIKACGNALMEHPDVNTRFTDTAMIQFKNANIGMAVATPDGLITPIIRAVNQKGLGQIARETKDMAGRAREKKLAISEFTGGTFGTSNLGMFGIEQFTAIINPPQSCNLAIAQASDELQLDEEGNVIKTKQMRLTLSCDHRVVDGAVGAKFLKTLKRILENPITLML